MEEGKKEKSKIEELVEIRCSAYNKVIPKGEPYTQFPISNKIYCYRCDDGYWENLKTGSIIKPDLGEAFSIIDD